MPRITTQRISLLSGLAIFCCVLIVGRAPLEAQTITDTSASFELKGRVISKSKYGFEVETAQGEVIEVGINESTDFALRMSSPWFDTESRTVAVDGKDIGDGQRERVNYQLPVGKLYLLTQFRSVDQRDRIMKQPAWRINNYLLSDQPIASALPAGDELLMSGEVDLKTPALIIDGKSYPIMLGHRGATLRGRSIADITPQETVAIVTGSQVNGSKTADTVIFMNR